MKQGIHPTWHHDCAVTCSCGNKFIIGSTFDTLQVDICNKCHPFFTGELRFVDRQGRIDRFKAKMQTAQSQQQNSSKSLKKAAANAKQTPAQSYQEILREQQVALKKANRQTQAAA